MSQAQPFHLPPPPASRTAAADPARARLRWEWIESVSLQSAHRVGTVALFSLVAALACAVKEVGPYGTFLAAAVVLADVALVAAIVSWWTQRRAARPARQSLGLLAFSASVLAVSCAMYVLAKTDHLQPLISWVISFFPPTQADA